MIEDWFSLLDSPNIDRKGWENEICEWAKLEWGKDAKVNFDSIAKAVVVNSGERIRKFTYANGKT